MKTIIIKNQQSYKNGIGIYGNYNRTKQNPNGLLFAKTVSKIPFKQKVMNQAIMTVINSIVLCDKYNIKTKKEFVKAKNNSKYSITKKDFKNNIKLKFEINIKGFKFVNTLL